MQVKLRKIPEIYILSSDTNILFGKIEGCTYFYDDWRPKENSKKNHYIEFMTEIIDLDMVHMLKSIIADIYCIFDINGKKITKLFKSCDLDEFTYSLDDVTEAQFVLRFIVEDCYESSDNIEEILKEMNK